MELSPVSDSTFNELVTQADKPVLVFFWAAWCGPCRTVQPIIEKIADTYAEEMPCYILDTDENRKTADNYGIRSIPAMLIFRGGEQLTTFVGYMPENTLKTKIKAALNKPPVQS